jgi:hypothetical protein
MIWCLICGPDNGKGIHRECWKNLGILQAHLLYGHTDQELNQWNYRKDMLKNQFLVFLKMISRNSPESISYDHENVHQFDFTFRLLLRQIPHYWITDKVLMNLPSIGVKK